MKTVRGITIGDIESQLTSSSTADTLPLHKLTSSKKSLHGLIPLPWVDDQVKFITGAEGRIALRTAHFSEARIFLNIDVATALSRSNNNDAFIEVFSHDGTITSVILHIFELGTDVFYQRVTAAEEISPFDIFLTDVKVYANDSQALHRIFE